MSRLWSSRVVPRLTNKVLASKQHHEIRARVCHGLTGEVVEIGFGSGLNTSHYPDAVTKVTAIEPSDLAWKLAKNRLGSSKVLVERAGLDGQRLPFGDNTFDNALSTWTLCTIPDPMEALREISRVLRPGGRLAFIEHGSSPDPKVNKWQRRIDPIQQRVFAGCHVNRKIDSLLLEAGFALGSLDTYYAPGEPKPFGYFYEGNAVTTKRQ